VEEGLSADGTLLTAQAELKCNNYTEIYFFSFMAYPRALTDEESVIKKIGDTIQTKQEEEGQEYLVLPEEIDGIALSWKEAKSYLVLKVLLLEVVILLLLPMLQRQKQKKEERERSDRLLLDYPDMVSKLAVLAGSGMSVKQAWIRISAGYSEKRQKNICKESPVYEEMLRTVRELEDGESERIAYERFGERCNLYAYHRFVRLLVQNLQKGTRGLCDLLELETETAFEERRTLARKLGEEAGTKMLFPLMLMMGIVMAIVIMPAIFEFIG
jgi:cytochrome c-type biogenesis protein CcmH/NrfG